VVDGFNNPWQPSRERLAGAHGLRRSGTHDLDPGRRTTSGPVAGHQNVTAAGSFDQLRELLAVHEAGEELILRAITRHHVPGGNQVADARMAEEHEAKETLAALEKLDVNSPEFAEGSPRSRPTCVDWPFGLKPRAEFRPTGRGWKHGSGDHSSPPCKTA
jgi:hypothetical protein